MAFVNAADNPNIKLGWLSAGGVLVLLLLSSIGWLVDDRTLNGVSVWSKPLKFNLSFFVHLVTLLLIVQMMRESLRETNWMQWVLRSLYAAVFIELLYIFLQASRGRHSHFNFETQWETAGYYGLMGGAALVVMLCTFAVGCVSYVEYRADKRSGLKLGIAIGATVGTIATLITAGALASGEITATGHWVGGELTDANGLPFFGWSTTGGDLRVSHFFATHMLQALPILGLLSDKVLPKFSALIVVLATVMSLAIVTFTFVQATSAEPFIVL